MADVSKYYICIQITKKGITMAFFESVWEGVKATSMIEWGAVLSSVIYVVLASRRSIYCWVFAFLGSSLFVYMCFNAQLYIESILQLFYVVMAIVGWLMWKKSENDDQSIKKWSFKIHFINVFLSGIAAVVLGYMFDTYTEQANPYVDAFTTCYSLLATFMVTKKVLGNWVYWIVIDLVSIYLYAQRGFNLTAFQYGIFTILAVYGFMAWLKEYNRQLEEQV